MATPQQYRGEARQLREQADAIADDHRETILEIARLYERLADHIETGADPKGVLVARWMR
jgi:hypothetical protein